MSIKRANQEDILRWPDGFWCYRYELPEMDHKSDDFEVITEESPEYELIAEEAA